MILRLKIKPFITSFKSRSAVDNYINSHTFTINNLGKGRCETHRNTFVGIVIHKKRKKVVQKRVKNQKKTKSTIISPTTWTVQTYYIPYELLKIANLKFEQKSNHFKIYPYKNGIYK